MIEVPLYGAHLEGVHEMYEDNVDASLSLSQTHTHTPSLTHKLTHTHTHTHTYTHSHSRLGSEPKRFISRAKPLQNKIIPREFVGS